MTTMFRYSIIRFRPFAETGEFANIGVVAMAIGTGETAYRLAPRRFGRVRNFFEDAAYAAYRKSVGYLRQELDRAVKELPLLFSDSDRALFFEISRQRESSVIFSESRILTSKDSLQTVVDALYERYIGRNFDAGENLENALTKSMRTVLRDNGIRFLKTVRIQDDVVPIVLPLGYQADEIYAIKPIAFSQKTPLNIFDHGASWKNRFEYLLNKGKLRPHNVLLAIDPPATHDSSLEEAYRLAEHELRELPFEIVDTANRAGLDRRIVEFASHLPIDSKALWYH